jgi:hypothetical protein
MGCTTPRPNDSSFDSNRDVLARMSADEESLRIHRFNLEMALSGRPRTATGRPFKPRVAGSNPAGGTPDQHLGASVAGRSPVLVDGRIRGLGRWISSVS